MDAFTQVNSFFDKTINIILKSMNILTTHTIDVQIAFK